MEKYWTELVAFISGGGLLSVLGYFRDKRKDKTDEFTNLIDKWKQHHEDVQLSLSATRENERQCEERYQRLTDEFNELKIKDSSMSGEIKHLQTEIDALRKKITSAAEKKT